MKLQFWACNFVKKETLAQVFSCEFWEISKNTFSYRTPPVAASVPRTTLLTNYKSFAGSHYDYGHLIYDLTSNESFYQRIESIQHNAVIVITGAIRGTSSEKLDQVLGYRVANIHQVTKKLYSFYKIIKKKSLSYLYNLIPDKVKFYATRSTQISEISNTKTRSNFLIVFFLLQWLNIIS